MISRLLEVLGEVIESLGTGISRADLLEQNSRLSDVPRRVQAVDEPDGFEKGWVCEDCSNFEDVRMSGFVFLCRHCRKDDHGLG